jgi:hypothetical protein
MAMISADNIKLYLSGGAANEDPAASLGGAMSTTAVTLSTLFDTVSGAEGLAGMTDYRCVYIVNEDSNADGYQNAKVWIEANTTSTDDTVQIGLDLAGKNGTADTIADENTAPDPAVTFSAACTDYASGLELGTLDEDDNYPIWIKRIVSASASAKDGNAFTIKVQGDSSEGA